MPQSKFDDDLPGKRTEPQALAGASNATKYRLLPLLTLFASDRGGAWAAYAGLPELTWRDPVPQPVDTSEGGNRGGPAKSYLWIGSILLVGFGMVELPDDGVGAEAGIRIGNEGESGLMVIGTAERVEEITVVKFYPTADCAGVLRRQIAFGEGLKPESAAVVACGSESDVGDQASGVAYRLRLSDDASLYVQCFIEEEGDFGGPGSTTFRFTRTPPFAVGVQD
jgi:hypothetical protein